MLIGLDFDNTIVSYDRIFHRVAVEEKWIEERFPAQKQLIRDHLRQTGREAAWTAMQGTVYGLRMSEAEPFPGVSAFFAFCRLRGLQWVIVSHKTKHPYAGPAYDLHAAALAWLAQSGLVGQEEMVERVYLEPTMESKARRIAILGCDLFVDDLPEFLGAPCFPPDVTGVVFDPWNRHAACPHDRVRSWDELAAFVSDRTDPT